MRPNQNAATSALIVDTLPTIYHVLAAPPDNTYELTPQALDLDDSRSRRHGAARRTSPCYIRSSSATKLRVCE